MVDGAGVRMTGPLSPYAPGVWRELRERGYTALSSRNVLRLMAHLSRWLQSEGLEPVELSAERIGAFCAARRGAGYTGFLTPRALRPILDYLRGAGGVSLPEAARHAPTPLDGILNPYVEYLRRERSLTEAAIARYASVVRQLLVRRFAHEPIALAALTARDVTAAVLRTSECYRIGTTKHTVTAFRSFLRYAYLTGQTAVNLTGALPAVAGWRLAGLPRGLDPRQVRQLLRHCDRRTHLGRRNYAIVLLMVRLGLRRGEVAALVLEDIDWQRAEVVIRGKGRREDRLPLPEDVGRAVAAYLRASRPRPTSCRHVFLRSCAPCGPLGAAAITAVATACLARAGIPCGGAHRLRHTAATEMLRRGGSLDEIAQVLRHQSADTTALYAKVDRLGLRDLAQPWPGGAR